METHPTHAQDIEAKRDEISEAWVGLKDQVDLISVFLKNCLKEVLSFCFRLFYIVHFKLRLHQEKENFWILMITSDFSMNSGKLVRESISIWFSIISRISL